MDRERHTVAHTRRHNGKKKKQDRAQTLKMCQDKPNSFKTITNTIQYEQAVPQWQVCSVYIKIPSRNIFRI